MKKIVLALGSIALLSTNVVFAQAKTDDEKTSIIKEMKSDMMDQMKQMGLDEATSTKFVDCYVNDMDKKLNLEELKFMKELDALKEGEEPTAEQSKKLDDLKVKLEDLGKDCMSIIGQ